MNEAVTLVLAGLAGVVLGVFFSAGFGGRSARGLPPKGRHFGSSAVCWCVRGSCWAVSIWSQAVAWSGYWPACSAWSSHVAA